MKPLVNTTELFKEAIDFRDKGQLEKAIEIFLKIIALDPNNGAAYTVLGGIYIDLDDYGQSFKNFKKATELNPNSEFASQGLYISLVELDKSPDAINEMKRFLEKNSAKMYKVTLAELLNDLEDGYMTNFKDTIVTLAKRNGVAL